MHYPFGTTQSERREIRRENRGPLPPDHPRHGTITGYVEYACRCDRCKKAGSDYMKKHNHFRTEEERQSRKDKYLRAREAGYSGKEASKRSFWSDPLREE